MCPVANRLPVPSSGSVIPVYHQHLDSEVVHFTEICELCHLGAAYGCLPGSWSPLWDSWCCLRSVIGVMNIPSRFDVRECWVCRVILLYIYIYIWGLILRFVYMVKLHYICIVGLY